MLEDERMFHEQVLDLLEKTNGVYVLIDEARDPISKSYIKVFAVKSDTDPMMWYYVIDFGKRFGRKTCSCDGYRFTNHCKHLGRVPEK